jgi:hypothetical protein
MGDTAKIRFQDVRQHLHKTEIVAAPDRCITKVIRRGDFIDENGGRAECGSESAPGKALNPRRSTGAAVMGAQTSTKSSFCKQGVSCDVVTMARVISTSGWQS